MRIVAQFPDDEDLFAGALAMPAAERSHYIARACTGDSVARARLTALLDSFDDAVGFFGECCVEQIGPYRLLRELGEGGCGIAYLAQQLSPVKRHVALKIIKPGMDTKAVVARFEAERQLLALMDHPNVAKVFDAGSTPAGRPYFVMELVRGLRITEYCEQLRLCIAERLHLFMQVCQAIQHAHHKGVMHRDIKPSNVLVTMHDGLPVVKVIDFGIAKATQGPLSEQTLHTAVDQFIGTPAYVSPEQTDFSQSNVDTRSDIYSLGVLLYELLTGHTPLDTQELLSSTPDEVRRRVREEEPITPSARLKSLKRSPRDVQGDLDWIVLRCLEKEPGRRYQTVNDLLLDIQRHLSHETVEARPPSVVYTVRKFARRNRTMFAAMLAAAAFVMAFVVNTSIQAQRVAGERARVEQERQRAEKVAEFMLETLAKTEPFGYADTGRPETAKELLDRAGRWVRQSTSLQPELRARFLESIGRACRLRSDCEEANSYLREALQLRMKMTGGVPDVATVEVMAELADSLRARDPLAAHRLLEEASTRLHQLGQERSKTYARVLAKRGRVQLDLGRPETAQQLFNDSMSLLTELLGARDQEVAFVLTSVSVAYLWQDDLAAAERTARESVDILRTVLPRLNPDRVRAEAQLAEVLRLQNRADEAALLFEEVLRNNRTLYGENSRRVADTLDSLGRARQAQHRLAEAEALAQQAVDLEIKVDGADAYQTGFFRTSLALIQIERKEYLKAEKQLRAALAALRSLPADHGYVASAEHWLGEVMLRTDRPKDAEALFTAALDRWKRSEVPETWVARSASGLGEALYLQGRIHEAEPLLVNSYRTLMANRKGDKAMQAAARERMVRFNADGGRQQQLLPVDEERTKVSSVASRRN